MPSGALPIYFIFATGIENSYPTIVGPKGERLRVDEMASCRHYERWREDFALVEELSLTHLRYGPPLHTTWLGDGRYDWAFADETFAALRERRIVPIVDLCHFGVPDWIGDFQNTEFPALFARYARAFAERYPWVQFFTPVNEMFVCALFSAKYGWWNERMTSDRSFVNALGNITKANVLAMESILEVRRDASFVQSESSEYFHARSPRAIGRAEFLNEVRFLSLDLNCVTPRELGDVRVPTRQRHDARGLPLLFGHTEGSGEIFGYHVITSQYYDRYRLPVMHTETNLAEGANGDEAERWLRKQWANVLRVRNDGVPIVGFTWYSLTDQCDWDTALREPNGNVNPVGLYDLDRKARNVGRAYGELIDEWREVLPTQSVVLAIPERFIDAAPHESSIPTDVAGAGAAKEKIQ